MAAQGNGGGGGAGLGFLALDGDCCRFVARHFRLMPVGAERRRRSPPRIRSPLWDFSLLHAINPGSPALSATPGHLARSRHEPQTGDQFSHDIFHLADCRVDDDWWPVPGGVPRSTTSCQVGCLWPSMKAGPEVSGPTMLDAAAMFRPCRSRSPRSRTASPRRHPPLPARNRARFAQD